MAKPSNAVSKLSYDGKTSYEIVPHGLTDGTYVASVPTMSADDMFVIEADFHTVNIQAEGTTIGSFLAKTNSDSDINIKASDLGLSSAMKFLGTSTTAISEGSTTSSITLNDGTTVTAVSGNVVLYGHKEFLFSGGKWEELGDESSHALKSVTITGTGALIGGGTLEANRQISHRQGDAANKTTGFYKFATDDYSHIKSVTAVVASDIKGLGFVDTSSNQTVGGVKTYSAPTNISGTEQATAVFKTANGGQIIFGKEAGNSGSMIALDQVAGTRRLNFRASATAGAIVWSQPESNSSLYYDVKNVYYRESTSIQFTNFKSAGALGTDANGNLKKVTLASVATSGSYNDLSNLPDLADVATSGSYNDLSDTPTIDSVLSSTSTNAVQNKVIYTALSGKQASLTTAQLNACNSGITSTKVTTYDGYASQISGKQDKLTAGSNITISGTTISSSYTDTKNTAGATAFGITGAPYYLIGASTQSDNPQTYSSAYCYIQTGSLYSNKHRVAETYTEDDEHYISTEAGFYKISGASTKNSDGTYNYVTILTTENIAEKGLFVPMTGTINTPMSGGIHQKIAYDVQTSSGGLTPASGGSVTTSTRYTEAFYGEKGFEYVYYGKDSNYGTDDDTAVGSYGITYKPLEGTTNTGYYTTVDTSLNQGINIWRVYTTGYGTNTGSTSFYTYLEYLSLLPDATIKYKSSGSTAVTTVDLKNLQTKLVSGTSIKTINSKSLLGSGDLSATDIISTATTSARGIAYLSGFQKVDGTGYATSGYFFDTETGWMICYGTTGSISGAGNIVTFAKSFVGAPLVVVSPFTKSTTETTISTQYRNACTVRCYRNTSGTASSSYSASTYYGSFILDTGNTESGYFSYIAIGKFK